MKAGITGHQNIDSNVKFWVDDLLPSLIRKFKIDYGYSCLAIGADQIFAECLRKLDIEFAFVLPSNRYEETFENNYDKRKYYSLKEKASEILKSDYEQPNEEAFYEAGKKVVKLSDIVFAIWNGEKSKGLGGTGDIVSFAINEKKKIVHLNTESKTVHIL